MTKPKFDQEFWEELWTKTLREHADKVARRPPNAYLTAEAAELAPGRALDAGCGHGAESLWLAAHGWQVTAVDFSAAALAQGRAMAEAAGADVASRNSVEAVVAALDPQVWELLVAEERSRAVAGSGVDAVIRAQRRH